MTATTILALAIAAVLVALYAVFRRHQFRRWVATESMPEELARSRLWASEKEIACSRPMRLRGRVDQIFLTPQGFLVPVESKRRQTRVIYDSDRLQLSLYRVILMNRWIHWLNPIPVSTHGYVRLVTPEGVVYRQTELMPLEQVTAYYLRYLDVSSRKEQPSLASREKLCAQCAYQPECPRFYDSSWQGFVRRLRFRFGARKPLRHSPQR